MNLADVGSATTGAGAGKDRVGAPTCQWEGITLTDPLVRAHAGGAQVARDAPAPGAPNKYQRRSN